MSSSRLQPVKQSIFRTLAVVLMGCLIAGCSWMRPGEEGVFLNPKDDYLDAYQHPELEVPEDLPEIGDSDPFPIPPTEVAENPQFYPNRPPLPDAIYANDKRDEVRIQRLGTRRWLVIPEEPTTVWPKLKQFLADNGVAVPWENPAQGRLNTQWLQVESGPYRDVVRTLLKDAKQDSTVLLGQDRFLVRVEQGLRPRTTEIHLRHENDSVRLPTPDALEDIAPLESSVTQAENDLLSEIGAYVAARVAEQTVSRVALQIGSKQKAELKRRTDGQPVLKLYLDFERAWATLGQALDNAEVEIVNLDRDNGEFNVVITEESLGGKESGGFLCRLTFTCDRDDEFDLKLLLGGDEFDYSVSVVDADKLTPIDPDLSQQILVLLREYST